MAGGDTPGIHRRDKHRPDRDIPAHSCPPSYYAMVTRKPALEKRETATGSTHSSQCACCLNFGETSHFAATGLPKMNQPKAGLHIRRSFRRSGSSMETIAVCRILATLGVAASMLLAVAPSSAETPQQHDWCYGKGCATPDMKMASCTAFIIHCQHHH